MWLERIELDGFGRFHDASWELTEGVTVLLGANEAGKTTLLNALRALLFGFESSRDGRCRGARRPRPEWKPGRAGDAGPVAARSRSRPVQQHLRLRAR
jgi:ABC-type uncharacterized transport system ATPase subunit